MKEKNDLLVKLRQKSMRSLLTLIGLALFTVLTVIGFIKSFTSPFVWVQVFVLTIIILVILKTQLISGWSMGHKWAHCLLGAPFIIGLISTGTQIQDPDNLLYFIFFILLAIPTSIKANSLIKDEVKKKRSWVIKKDNQELLESEKKNKFLLNLSKAEATWQQIIERKTASLAEIKDVNYILKAEHLKTDVFLRAVLRVKLQNLLTVSHIKKQLVWDSDLEMMLSLLDRIYVSSYNDEVLAEITEIKESFIEYLLSLSDYVGYRKLSKIISEACADIK